MLIYKKNDHIFMKITGKNPIKQEVWQVFDRGKAKKNCKSGDSAIFHFFSFNLLGQLLIFVKTNIIGIILTLPL